MRSKKLLTLTFLGASLLLLTVGIEARERERLHDLNLKLKSEITALRYTLFGTLVPIAAAVASFLMGYNMGMEVGLWGDDNDEG